MVVDVCERRMGGLTMLGWWDFRLSRAGDAWRTQLGNGRIALLRRSFVGERMRRLVFERKWKLGVVRRRRLGVVRMLWLQIRGR
jgi:hypothetical protein